MELLGETRSSQISVLFPHVYSTADPDNQPPRQVVGVEAGGVVGEGRRIVSEKQEWPL